MKTVAWSEQRENRIKWQQFWMQFMVWMGVGIVLTAGISKNYRGAIVGVCVVIVGMYLWLRVDAKRTAMLQNKPGNAAAVLTQWHQWPSYARRLTCPCGIHQTFEGKSFYPNSVDAGGGRFAFVCECGKGHYKLGAPPEGSIKTGQAKSNSGDEHERQKSN